MDALTPSLENYLEAILIQNLEKKVARVKDIASLLNVRVASVIGAVKALSEKGLIFHEKYGYIELTQKGIELAKEIYEKHKALSSFFHQILGIDPVAAAEDACKIEHHISKKTMDRLVKFIEFVETCPEGEPLWLSSFHYYAKHGSRPDICNRGGKRMEADSLISEDALKLNELKVGQKGIVLKISANAPIKRKLLEMGIVPKVEIKVEKVAPLGDPVDIIVKGYHLSLRKDEAAAIIVRV